MIDKFFILSTGRTGTLSLAHSLKACGMNAYHEHFAHARILSNKRWDDKITDDEIRKSIREFYSKREGFYIDSDCLLWNIVDLLEEHFKGEVGYIYVHRDSKKTINSMFRTDFYKVGKPGGGWGIRAKTGFMSMTAKDYNEKDRYYNCAYTYKIRTETIVENLHNIDSSRVLELPFEKMVKEPNLSSITSFVERLSGKKFVCRPLSHKHQSVDGAVVGFDISKVLGSDFKRSL